jgi:hypothetical protein
MSIAELSSILTRDRGPCFEIKGNEVRLHFSSLFYDQILFTRTSIFRGHLLIHTATLNGYFFLMKVVQFFVEPADEWVKEQQQIFIS